MDVAKILIEMGITPALLGFEYIQIAIYKLRASDNKITYGELIKQIAEEKRTTKSAVVCAFRHAITRSNKKSPTYKKFIINEDLTQNEFIRTLEYTTREEREEAYGN